MRTLAIAITLALTLLTLNIRAQNADVSQPSPSPGGSPGGGPGHGQKGQHQRPSPEQMAAHLMEKFDANKDGELSQDELTQALESLRKDRPHGPGAGGGQGEASGGPSQGGQGGPGHGPGGGGQQGARQGGAGGGHQGPPPADKVAAHMIEKFSSDKKGLTQAELTKALEEHRGHRGQHEGGGHAGGPGGGAPGAPSADKPSGPPPSDGATQ